MEAWMIYRTRIAHLCINDIELLSTASGGMDDTV